MEGNGMCYSVASGRLPYRPLTMRHQLTFLHHCLLTSAECVCDELEGSDLSQPLEKNQATKLRLYLTVLCDNDENILDQYLAYIRYALSPGAGM